MKNFILWSVVIGGSIMITSCNSKTSENTQDSAVATESAPAVTEEAPLEETQLTTEEIKGYAVSTFHYDSAFGTRLSSKGEGFQSTLNGHQLVGTNILFEGHKLSVTNHYHKENDSIVSTFYYDSTAMDALKQSNGQVLNSVKLSFSSAPSVAKYDIGSDAYYVVKGTPLNATGKTADFTYALVFDLSKKTVYYISTLSKEGEFYFRSKNGHLAYLETVPAEGEEKLTVNEKVLNF